MMSPNSTTFVDNRGGSSGGGATTTVAPSDGIMLFGVRVHTQNSMRKSASMNNLSQYEQSQEPNAATHVTNGYLSDDVVHATSGGHRDRKKGIPWTEEEHRLFLLGLQKVGKGDWRGISRNYVKTRTPTQVASHAQKYFLRQSNLNKRRRRHSLFDITQEEEYLPPPPPPPLHDTPPGVAAKVIRPIPIVPTVPPASSMANLCLNQKSDMEASSSSSSSILSLKLSNTSNRPSSIGGHSAFQPISNVFQSGEDLDSNGGSIFGVGVS